MKHISEILKEIEPKMKPNNPKITKEEASALVYYQFNLMSINEAFALKFTKLYYDLINNNDNYKKEIPIKDAVIILETTLNFIFSDESLAKSFTKQFLVNYQTKKLDELTKTYQNKINLIKKKGTKKYENKNWCCI